MKKVFELINNNLQLSRAFERFKRDPETEHPPLITISREYGSGGSIVAQKAAAFLGKPWRVYHEQILDEIARESNLEKKLIREIDESRIPFVEEIINDFFGQKFLSLNSYSKHLVKILSQIGNRGHTIIVGRGANFLFPYSLKVRVVGEMNNRINVLMKLRKVSRAKAQVLIEESDKKRKEFIKQVYNHDPRKAHHYNVVIKTSKYLSPDDAAYTIAMLARRRFKLRNKK